MFIDKKAISEDIMGVFENTDVFKSLGRSNGQAG